MEGGRAEAVSCGRVGGVDVCPGIHDERRAVPKLEGKSVVVTVAAVPVLADVTASDHDVGAPGAHDKEATEGVRAEIVLDGNRPRLDAIPRFDTKRPGNFLVRRAVPRTAVPKYGGPEPEQMVECRLPFEPRG